jgi:hypothetical protein
VTQAVWITAIDFDDNGLFTGTGEDVSARVRTKPGIRCSRGRDQIRALAPPAVGAASFDLDNRSRDYSTENGSSPLVGKLVPGHRVRIQANDGTLRNVWRGFNADFPQHPQRTEKSVSVPCLGPLSFLQGKRPSTPLYADIRTDTALGLLLDAVGWPAGDRTLDTGQTTLLYWWLDGQTDALAMAVKLLNSEGPGASLYESGDGKIVFESRHYRLLTARSTTSQATFGDAATEPKHSPDGFGYEPGLKDVIGTASVSINRRTLAGVAVVWSFGEALRLAASEVRTFRVQSSDPLSGVITPAAGTDYTLVSGAVTPALDRTGGAIVSLTLTAGAAGATLTGLQLRADKLTATAETVTDQIAASTIQGAKDYTLDLWPEIAHNQAQDIADLIATAYGTPRPTVTIALKNANASRLTQMLTREVSDRVTVNESQTGLAAACFVERVEHIVTEAGRFQTTLLGLEKISAAMYPTNVVTIDGTAGNGIDSAATIWY